MFYWGSASWHSEKAQERCWAGVKGLWVFDLRWIYSHRLWYSDVWAHVWWRDQQQVPAAWRTLHSFPCPNGRNKMGEESGATLSLFTGAETLIADITRLVTKRGLLLIRGNLKQSLVWCGAPLEPLSPSTAAGHQRPSAAAGGRCNYKHIHCHGLGSSALSALKFPSWSSVPLPHQDQKVSLVKYSFFHTLKCLV